MRIKLWLIVFTCIIGFFYSSLEADCLPIDSTLAAKGLNNVEIQLSCDKEEFIQGESVDILVKIINKSENEFTMYTPKHYIYDIDKDSTYYSFSGNALIDIPAGDDYYFMIDPQKFIAFDGMDFSTNSLKPGNYSYYISLDSGNEKIVSDKISVRIKQVPDSLKNAYNDLKRIPNQPRTYESTKKKAKEYKSNFYEQQFYIIYLTTRKLKAAITNNEEVNSYRTEAIEQYKEFILKYPNSSNACRLFQLIMFDSIMNQFILEETILSLNMNNPDCKLLEVLRHNSYLNINIKDLIK